MAEPCKLEGPSPDGVFVLTLQGSFDHRFTKEAFTKINAALDTVEKHDGPAALVIIGEGEKFFSNGFLLDFLMGEPEEALRTLHKMFERFLEYPVPTIAAMNGHSFAGGGMLALCCDFRVMNEAKGMFCLNELDIGLAFTHHMDQLIRSKLDTRVVPRVMLGADRFTGKECLQFGIVHHIAPPDAVVATATNLAKQYAKKDKANYRQVKQQMYANALAVMRADQGLPTLPGTGGNSKL